MTGLLAPSLVPVATLVLATTGTAAASSDGSSQGDRRTTLQATEELRDAPWRPRLSAALGAGNTRGAMLAGGFRVMGGIEPSPVLFLGLSYRGVRGLGESDGYDESLDTDMVSGALEVHPAGAFWADPYVSADLGYGWYSKESENEYWSSPLRRGLAAALGLGFAFRSKHMSGGPQLSYITVPAAETSSLMLDLRLDVRF